MNDVYRKGGRLATVKADSSGTVDQSGNAKGDASSGGIVDQRGSA